MAHPPLSNDAGNQSILTQGNILGKFDFRLSVSHESAAYIPALLSSNVIYVSTGYFDKEFTLQRFATVELPNDRKRVVRLAFSNAAAQLMLATLDDGEFFAAKIGSATTFDFGQITNFGIHTRTTFEVEHEDAIRHSSIGALYFDRPVYFKNEILVSLITPDDAEDEDIDSLGSDFIRQLDKPQNLRVRNALVALDPHVLEGPISDYDLKSKLTRFTSTAKTIEDIQIGCHHNIEYLIFDSYFLKHNDLLRTEICEKRHHSCPLDERCPFITLSDDHNSFLLLEDCPKSQEANQVIDSLLLKIDDRNEDQKSRMTAYLDGEKPDPTDTFKEHVKDLPDKKIDHSKIPNLMKMTNFTYANHDEFSLPSH